jgi:hypothetical protein
VRPTKWEKAYAGLLSMDAPLLGLGVGSRASPLAAVDDHSRLAYAELLGSDDGAGEECCSSRSDAARRNLNPVGNLECSNTTEQTCPPNPVSNGRASFGA